MGEKTAVVIGAAGGIGAALIRRLGFEGPVIALSRRSDPAVDLLDEPGIVAAVAAIAQTGAELRLVIDATGFLHGDGFSPERSLRQIDPAHMARSFAINAIGPALLMKSFLPALPRQGRSVFATLSARVGSIGDNSLGGWYSYRAAKAALNQLVHTAAIELRRSHPEAICIAIHPGTVATDLSAPFAKTGLELQTADEAAGRILAVLNGLHPEQTGGFLDHHGKSIQW